MKTAEVDILADEFFPILDKNYPKFKWMLEDKDKETIEQLIQDKDMYKIIHTLSNLWLTKIPDYINLKNNQPGVSEILHIIEF